MVFWEIKPRVLLPKFFHNGSRRLSDKEDDISYYQGSYAGYELNDGEIKILQAIQRAIMELLMLVVILL